MDNAHEDHPSCVLPIRGREKTDSQPSAPALNSKKSQTRPHPLFVTALIPEPHDPLAPKLHPVPPPRAVLSPSRIADPQVGDHDLPRLRMGVGRDEGVQEAGLRRAHCDDGFGFDEERVAFDDGDVACCAIELA